MARPSVKSKAARSKPIRSRTSTAPPNFKVSPAIIGEPPDRERAGMTEWLWNKSGGICALCDEALPADGRKIQTDHREARKAGSGGKTLRENLYLACSQCNNWKTNMPFELAAPLIRFRKWSVAHQFPTYEDVAELHFPTGPKAFRASFSEDTVLLKFARTTVSAHVSIDPATGTRYFFGEIPIEYIENDEQSQPHRIEWDHVWELARDFHIHPVHKPSNCRMVRQREVYHLLQFDGQHKTTAQILLGRKSVPMKIYVEPDLAMIQELVLQIQQGIKKRPLSTSDTLRKLGDVVGSRLSDYHEKRGVPRTEAGFIASQPLEIQTARRKEFVQALERAVLLDDENKLLPYVARGRKAGELPIIDRVLVEKLIRPMLCKDMLSDDIDDARDYRRDAERKNILVVLNTIAEVMLEDKWPAGAELDRRRAQVLFYQGSIGWWRELLIEAIRNKLNVVVAERDRIFLRTLKPKELSLMRNLVRALCAWDIWSNPSAAALKAMRSNTIKDVTAAFPSYNEIRLMREA